MPQHSSPALENHWTEVSQSKVYMKYIATRPRAERFGSHGLFGDEDTVNLECAKDRAALCSGAWGCWADQGFPGGQTGKLSGRCGNERGGQLQSD